MICPFCRKEFSAENAGKECRSCTSFGGCRRVKCPYCGYESPREPDFFGWIRTFVKKRRTGDE